jgi:hypothetical protein
MQADPLMRFFHDLRTSIEKKAHTPTTVSVHIKAFSLSTDIARLEPRPPGATWLFIGDRNGGSGWLVRKPDGTEEAYYVELPEDIGDVKIHLPGAPEIDGGAPATAEELVARYLDKVEATVHEAKREFANPRKE